MRRWSKAASAFQAFKLTSGEIRKLKCRATTHKAGSENIASKACGRESCGTRSITWMEYLFVITASHNVALNNRWQR